MSDKKRKLTEKQEKFCQFIVLGMSQSDAYRNAYNVKNMSDRVIHNKAYELSKKSEIGVRLEELKSERMKRLNYDADQVLITLSEMLRADVLDIYDKDLGTLKPLEQWPKVWRTMLDSADVQEIFDGTGKDRELVGYIKKVKFVSKAKLLELVGKHTQVGAYTQLHKHDITETLADELKKAIKRKEENKE